MTYVKAKNCYIVGGGGGGEICKERKCLNPCFQIWFINSLFVLNYVKFFYTINIKILSLNMEKTFSILLNLAQYFIDGEKRKKILKMIMV